MRLLSAVSYTPGYIPDNTLIIAAKKGGKDVFCRIVKLNHDKKDLDKILEDYFGALKMLL